MVTKAVARRALGRTEGLVQHMAVESIRVDAEDGADDVGTVLENGTVLGDGVD